MIKGDIIKIKIIFIIVLILIISIMPGCINEDGDQEDGDSDLKDFKENIDYHFSISFNKISNATIIIPIPVLNNNSIDFDYSNNNLTKGNAKLNLIESNYGPALKIIINESNQIEFSTTKKIWYHEEYKKSNLSMYSETLPNNVEYYCWIYYDGPRGANITIAYHRNGAGYGHVIGQYGLNDDLQELDNNWNKVIVNNRFPVQ